MCVCEREREREREKERERERALSGIFQNGGFMASPVHELRIAVVSNQHREDGYQIRSSKYKKHWLSFFLL